MELVYTDGGDSRFQQLCHELDDYLNEVVGGENQREKYNQFNTLEDIHDVILVVDNGKTIGCGSFKRYDEYTAEIKRVFISEKYRRKGCAKQLMEALENSAKEAGFLRLILETGGKLRPAIELYESLGYEIIENYGQYTNMSESVCMAKSLED